jgi:hypothetical protein
LRNGSTVLDSKVLDAGDITAGTVDLTSSALAESSYTIDARLTDAAGNVGADSSGVAVTIDTTAPGAPTGIVVTPADQGSGPLQTDSTQPTFRISLPGSAAAGDTVTLEIDTVDDATAALSGGDITNGYVDIQSANVLADDTLYDISAFITDVAGNEGNSNTAVEVEVGDASSNPIPAVVYDGVQGYMLHTGGPSGAADGAELTICIQCTFNSDGSDMVLAFGDGTVPYRLVRNSDNTIDFIGGTAGAVFSVSTTAVAASLGLVTIVASATGTDAGLTVTHALGTITGINTAGSASNLDLTADLYFGSVDGADDFLDADVHVIWLDAVYLDAEDPDIIEQFVDTSTNTPRDPGADGSNPLDGDHAPLVCHKAPAATHTVNAGTGGDADTAGVFTDGTSPGSYAGDFTAGSPARMLQFDGSSTVVEWSTEPTGIANGRTGTWSFVFNRKGNAGAECMFYIGTGSGEDVFFGFDSSDHFVARFADGAGATILGFVSTSTFDDSANHVVTISHNISTIGGAALYWLLIDGADETGTPTVGTAADIDLTDNWRIGSTDDSGNRLWFTGTMGDFIFFPVNVPILEANTIKYFDDGSGNPMDHGSDGSATWGEAVPFYWLPTTANPETNVGTGDDADIVAGSPATATGLPNRLTQPAYVANALHLDGSVALGCFGGTSDGQRLVIAGWFKRDATGAGYAVWGQHDECTPADPAKFRWDRYGHSWHQQRRRHLERDEQRNADKSHELVLPRHFG